MRFVGISNEDLNDLHRSMELFEQLYGDSEFFNPYLFVIVNQGPLLVLAKDAIQEGGVYEEGQEADQPSAIAVAIPLGSDALHYLTGSGLYVGDAKEEFAYAAGNGEGVRTGNFTYAGGRERLHLNQILALALAEDDTYLDEFLQSHGPKEAVKTETPEEPVERTEKVTQSSAKRSGQKGIDKVLISGKPLSHLKVTELIEVSDFVVDHKRGSYLHAEVKGNDWLFYSNDSAEGKAAVERMLMLKLDLDDKPEVSVLAHNEISDLLEGLVDEQE